MSRRERKLLRRQGKKYQPDETITKQEAAQPQKDTPKKQKLNPVFRFYEKHNVRLMWITVAMLIISLIIIGVHTAVYGEFIPRGISLKGGVTITVPYEGQLTIDDMQSYLREQFPDASLSVRSMSGAGGSLGFIIDASDADPDELVKSIGARTGNTDKISVETMESALGAAFFKQVMLAMLAAFVLMAIVVFLSFKTFVPSAAVILAAVSNIAMTIAVIDIFGIKIETAGIAALLMLIGYSVDTDILLTTRVLKRTEGTLMDRILGAMKTGMTMTITAIAAVLVAYIFTQSETLRQIMLILMIGLFFDMFNTWIQNTGILMLYVQHKSKKQAKATLAGYKDEDEKDEAVDADYEDIESEEDAEEAEEKEEKEEKKEHKAQEHHTEHHAAQHPEHKPEHPAHQAQPEHHVSPHTHHEEHKK